MIPLCKPDKFYTIINYKSKRDVMCAKRIILILFYLSFALLSKDSISLSESGLKSFQYDDYDNIDIATNALCMGEASKELAAILNEVQTKGVVFIWQANQGRWSVVSGTMDIGNKIIIAEKVNTYKKQYDDCFAVNSLEIKNIRNVNFIEYLIDILNSSTFVSKKNIRGKIPFYLKFSDNKKTGLDAKKKTAPGPPNSPPKNRETDSYNARENFHNIYKNQKLFWNNLSKLDNKLETSLKTLRNQVGQLSEKIEKIEIKTPIDRKKDTINKYYLINLLAFGLLLIILLLVKIKSSRKNVRIIAKSDEKINFANIEKKINKLEDDFNNQNVRIEDINKLIEAVNQKNPSINHHSVGGKKDRDKKPKIQKLIESYNKLVLKEKKYQNFLEQWESYLSFYKLENFNRRKENSSIQPNFKKCEKADDAHFWLIEIDSQKAIVHSELVIKYNMLYEDNRKPWTNGIFEVEEEHHIDQIRSPAFMSPSNEITKRGLIWLKQKK